MSTTPMNRSEFLKLSAGAVAGMSVASLTAKSYARIPGANDRLRIGIVGSSERGRGALLPALFKVEKVMNAELTAVCDLWSVNLEKGLQLVKARTGRTPAGYRNLDEMLNTDLDGVIVATGDPQHAPLLARVVNAGKDCYCEKPMAINVPMAKEAAQAVKRSGRIVQIGTQGLSDPGLWGLRKFIASGKLGKISHVEQVQSYWGPRWRGRSEPGLIKEEETNWKEWLGKYPPRSFDPRLYFEYRVFKDFSTGIAGQWMSHQVAAVALAMGESFPHSVSSDGGIFVWNDGRETPDVFAAHVVYPSGWMYTYMCNFGTDYPRHERYYGLNGTIEEGPGGYVVSGIGGGGDDTPQNRERMTRQKNSAAGFHVNPNKIKEKFTIPPEGGTPGETIPAHMQNWLECMRSRKTPNADVMTGYCHSVACIMAHQSGYVGRKLYWDRQKEEIVETPPGRV
ncbi:MAG: Gfo/Idh/MocA family oxidoreductase [Verrucomicrobia bacterium]|nr:Gfo/Idh/MocA family oxidoreductase [Verrucomicrobiota bacterium]